MERLTRRRNRADAAHFWAQLVRHEDCLVWPGALEWNGYARVHWRGMRWRAHRLAYWLAHPEWDRTGYVCHTCDNRQCCNPAHLWLGSALENALDMHGKNRAYHARGEGNGHAKLTDAAIADIRSSPLKQAELAAKYGVVPPLISMIRSGKRWGHL